MVPIGAVIDFAGPSAPSGWALCYGQTISRTVYAALFALIGTTYGAGDGSTTFQIPDLRGEFLRGLDRGRGVDTARAMASAQSDAVKNHTHDFSIQQGGTFAGSGSVNSLQGTTTPAGTYAGTTSNGGGGSETRPRNVAVDYVIFY